MVRLNRKKQVREEVSAILALTSGVAVSHCGFRYDDEEEMPGKNLQISGFLLSKLSTIPTAIWRPLVVTFIISNKQQRKSASVFSIKGVNANLFKGRRRPHH